MGIFDQPPRMLTEEEKKANIEKYRVVRPLGERNKETFKPETPEEKAKRRADFAQKMAGKGLSEMGTKVVHEKYVPGKKREDGENAQ